MNKSLHVILIVLVGLVSVYAQETLKANKDFKEMLGRAPRTAQGKYFTDEPTISLRGVNGPAYGQDALGNQIIKLWLNAPANMVLQGSNTMDLYCGDFDGAGVFYAIDNLTSNLVTIDTSTGAATIIGAVAAQTGHTWTGMSWDAVTNTMYASSTDGITSALYTLDLTTPSSTLVGTNSTLTLIIDIAIDPNGQMYCLDLNDNIYLIDKTNFTETLLGATGFDANFAQGMDFNPETGELYLAAYNNLNSSAELRLVNLTNGSAALIGPIGAGTGVEVCAFGIVGSAGDDLDPNPPENVVAYSDYLTPTSMALTWTDPTTLVNGTPISPGDFKIEIERDGISIASVDGGTESYPDAGLTDGVLYEYTLYTKLVANDSTSSEQTASWYAGGSPTPSSPVNLAGTFSATDAVLTWTDPTTQEDGTFLDDLDSILVYRDGVHIASVLPGVETFTDMPAPGFLYTYTVLAKDDETPPNLSTPSNEASGFVGTAPDYLVWVGPTIPAGTGSALSGDSIFAALVANGEGAFLTNNLFEFGSDLSIYQGVFVDLGIFSNNHVLPAGSPEALALETYLANGGNVYLEGGDCFYYDPQFSGGHDINPWFDCVPLADGSGDVFNLIGLNDLSTFNFAYNGENNWMDQLSANNSTPVWQEQTTLNIHGLFYFGFSGGSGKSIGMVPLFGGMANSTTALNSELRIAKETPEVDYIIETVAKSKVYNEYNENFVKKAAYYPELKKQRNSEEELFKYTSNGVQILANNKVDLMAAYLAFFNATAGPPVITLSNTVYNDSLLVNGTTTETLTIGNAGGTLGSDLGYSIAENPAVSWLSVMPTSGTITTNNSEDITLSFDATGMSTGDYTTTLDISSNDPVNPLVNVTVNLNVNAAPVISIDPDTFDVTVASGSTASDTLKIKNDGVGPLNFTIDKGPHMLPSQIEGEEIFGSTANPFSGGARTRGNIFSVTTATSLIEHRIFLDIPTSTDMHFFVYEGTAVTGTYNIIDDIFIASSGSGQGFYSSGPTNVPLEVGKYYYIGAGWNASATYYRSSDPTPLPTSFGMLETGIPGDITSGYPPAATANNTYTAFSPYYCAIVTGAGIDWLGINPTSGSIAPGDSMDIDLTFDPTGLLGGDYNADIIVNSNDPVNPEVRAGAHMFVQADALVGFNPEPVVFDTTFVNETRDMSAYVLNPGAGVLNVTSITSSNPVFSISPTTFDVPALDSVEVTVSFAPTTQGSETGTITINSNAANDPSYDVSVSGIAVPEPIANVDPSVMNMHMEDSTDAIINITNTGGSNLIWSASTSWDPVTAAKPAVRMIGPAPAPSNPANTDYDDMASSQGTPPSGPIEGFGDMLMQLNLNTITGATSHLGCAYADGHFWVTSSEAGAPPNWLHKIDEAGTLVQSYSQPTTGWGWRDLAYDGTFLYGSVSPAIEQIDPATGQPTGVQIPGPINPNRAIGYDPATDHFWVTGFAPEALYEIDRAGNIINQFASPIGAYGIAWDVYFDTAKPYLWLNAGTATGDTHHMDQVDPLTGQLTGLSIIGLTGNIAGGLDMTTEMSLYPNLAVLVAIGQTDFLSVWEIAEAGVPWLTMSPTSGIIQPQDVGSINVRAYMDYVNPDTAYIVLNTNAPSTPTINVMVIRDTNVVGIEDPFAIPTSYAVSNNYPNPFNPSTTINYQLPQRTDVKLVIYNVLGQKVRMLINKQVEAGYHSAVWDGHNDTGQQVATGLYIYRFEAANYSKTMKMMLLK